MADLVEMNVRSFLRGGYRQPGPPVAVVNGDHIEGVWLPGWLALRLLSLPEMAREIGRNGTTPLINRPVTPAPKPSQKGRG